MTMSMHVRYNIDTGDMLKYFLKRLSNIIFLSLPAPQRVFGIILRV